MTREQIKENIKGWLEEIDRLNARRSILLEKVIKGRVEYEALSRAAFYRGEREKRVDEFVATFGKKHNLKREDVLLLLEDSPELLSLSPSLSSSKKGGKK